MVSKNILDNSDKKYLSPRKINFFGFYFSFAVNRKQEILLAITGFENELVMNNGLIRSTGYDRLVYTISLSGLHEQISIGLNDAENSIVGVGGITDVETFYFSPKHSPKSRIGCWAIGTKDLAFWQK